MAFTQSHSYVDEDDDDEEGIMHTPQCHYQSFQVNELHIANTHIHKQTHTTNTHTQTETTANGQRIVAFHLCE